MLRLPSLEWQKANNFSGGDVGGPAPRRAHSTALFTGSDGSTRVALYGGRLRSKELLSDVWIGTLDWPRIRWERVFDPAAAQAAGSVPDKDYPAPRKGHVGMVHDDGTGPRLIVHGGRNDTHYFSRVWQFDLEGSRSWVDITPALGAVPAPRDHHAAVVSGERLIIYGGRSGVSYATSAPTSDVWSFHLPSRSWRMEAQRGLTPLPRFLASSLLYKPANSSDRLLVFGGETGSSCKLNDVW